MIKNILLITRRTLIKNKTYTLINIGGLMLGIAVYILISAYVSFERSYDRFNPDADNIYRVESSFYKGGNLVEDWPTSTNGYATAMKQSFTGIASIVRIDWHESERVVRYNNTKFREEHVCFADTNFFTFFNYPLIKGNPKTVLKEVNTMVISQSAAQKYFGNANPVGKVLEVSTQGGPLHCMITGVFKDVPKNSTMQFNYLLSWATQSNFMKDFWYMHESYTFLKLRPGIDPHTIETGFPALAERHKTGQSLRDLKWVIKLVPLTDIHLNLAKQYEIEPKGNRTAVKFLEIIAYVILLIACVNYINLSTAKAIDRAREVGIRKVNGANSMQLLGQFLFESLFINAIALVLGIILVILGANLLPQLLSNKVSFGLLFNARLYGQTALVFAGSILFSGTYPALLLSRLKPVNVLKGKYTFSKGGLLLRKGMVAFQFAASLLLIAGTFAVYRQIVFMNSQTLGININRTIVLKAPISSPNYIHKLVAYKQVLLNIPGVSGVTNSGAVPGKEVGEFYADRKFGDPKTEEHTYEMLKVDHDFIKNYNLQIVAGRAFDKSRPADSTGLVLNEAAVKQLGFASDEAAVGKQVWIETKENKPDLVIGVLKDYHQQSLRQNYTPVILFMDPAFPWVPINYVSLKFSGNNPEAIINNIKSSWSSTFPESSFDWFFLDDFYNNQYQQDLQFGKLFMLFTGLAILIACMGLFGLTAYSTSRRIKEIGVRKVLGASVTNIISILTMDAAKLVLFSSVLALPLAWLFIRQWLDGYAFRVTLTWWEFAAPVVALLLISMSTIGYITYKAALANPIKSLRNE